jgi:UDP-3-O-[3-hydroxymyristoyl] glucosamine N-acyltransferase
MELTVKELAQQLEAELVGDGSARIRSVGPVASADESTITFISDKKHLSELGKSRAGAVIVGEKIEGLIRPQLVVRNVNAALIEVMKIYAPKLKPALPGVDPTAKVGRNVRLDKNASIGAYVVIDDNVEIGAGSVISSGCRIGENTKIGENTRLDCNVVVYHNCTIGGSVIIQANTTIGSTGFGYAFINGAHRLIPHNGIVVIEDFVEIGANCCVDRAKFGETRIGAGTKIDNLVQIAHNVIIGKCCLIAGQVGISGSCRLGDGVVLGGQVGLADNIEVGAGTMVGAQAGIVGNVPPGSQLAWSPAIDRKEALRVVGTVLRLPKLAEQLKQLAARVEKLETAKDNKQRS